MLLNQADRSARRETLGVVFGITAVLTVLSFLTLGPDKLPRWPEFPRDGGGLPHFHHGLAGFPPPPDRWVRFEPGSEPFRRHPPPADWACPTPPN